MPATNHPKTFKMRIRAAGLGLAAIGSLCFLAGCMQPDAAIGPKTDVGDSAPGLQEKAAGKPGVPYGCTREWSVAAGDSVLYCPDVLPPSPN